MMMGRASSTAHATAQRLAPSMACLSLLGFFSSCRRDVRRRPALSIFDPLSAGSDQSCTRRRCVRNIYALTRLLQSCRAAHAAAQATHVQTHLLSCLHRAPLSRYVQTRLLLHVIVRRRRGLATRYPPAATTLVVPWRLCILNDHPPTNAERRTPHRPNH